MGNGALVHHHLAIQSGAAASPLSGSIGRPKLRRVEAYFWHDSVEPMTVASTRFGPTRRAGPAHSSGMVKLLMNVGGSPLNGGIFARRNTMLTQLPVSVSRNLAVRVSTDCTSPSCE